MHIIFRAIQVTYYVICIGLAILILWLVVGGKLSAEHPTVEYKDFVAILLTGLAVMIAVATVVAAAAAIFGYAIIREEIIRTVERVATKRAEEIAKECTNDLVPRLVSEAVDFSKEGGPKTKADQIADEYSKEVGNNG